MSGSAVAAKVPAAWKAGDEITVPTTDPKLGAAIRGHSLGYVSPLIRS